jgi:hypothetical protein
MLEALARRLFKKRLVRCTDGSEIEVFRHPNDAVPLYVEIIQAEARAAVNVANSVSASASGKYREP